MPVITAHPSEVRRKSVIDRVSRIAETFDAYDRATPETRAGRSRPTSPSEILILWATRQLRPMSLGVADEIDNAVSFFERTFLPELPRVYADLEAALGGRGRGPPSFLRIGSWVGGDRDGNPNVTAETLRLAFLTQSRLVVGHYLEEIHALGAALSLSTEHVKVTPELAALADGSGDAAPQRADEPYRRALSGIYARLAAAAPALTGAAAGAARRRSPARPTPSADRAEGRPAGHPGLRWSRHHGEAFRHGRLPT